LVKDLGPSRVGNANEKPAHRKHRIGCGQGAVGSWSGI